MILGSQIIDYFLPAPPYNLELYVTAKYAWYGSERIRTFADGRRASLGGRNDVYEYSDISLDFAVFTSGFAQV